MAYFIILFSDTQMHNIELIMQNSENFLELYTKEWNF